MEVLRASRRTTPGVDSKMEKSVAILKSHSLSLLLWVWLMLEMSPLVTLLVWILMSLLSVALFSCEEGWSIEVDEGELE